jgi:hypothetical protein
MRRFSRLLASLMLASGCAGQTWALPKPMTLNPVFDNTVPSEVKRPPGGSLCPVRIVALEDVRRSPEMIGIYDRRPIYAPGDRTAWLKSIANGLGSRGIAVAFDSEATASNAATVKLDLTTAWITNTSANVSASAVFRMQVTTGNAGPFGGYYRGSNSRMPYWSTGPSILQRAIDHAFARVLDSMATDLLKTCQA